MKKKVAVIAVLIVILLVALLATLASTVKVETVLDGDEEITLTDRAEYEEPGAHARISALSGLIKADLQNCDLVIDGEVNSAVPGDYQITYEAVFMAWSGIAQRTVHVVDTAPPVITLEGPETVYLSPGQEYQEAGYSAEDDYDGDLTEQVAKTVDGSTITYTVTDSSGNEATATRTVTTQLPAGKIVYLTFDDGPGPYTQQLLDVLAAHHVLATFFVTATGDNSMIAREAAAGHTIGVHSATHNYGTIYSSEEAFLADFENMQSIIQQQTGRRAQIFRFPGGSSNTVSNFNPGIMTRLAASMTSRGYQYFDWNVSSGDAGGTTSADQVYENVINGIRAHDVSVVLQHDVKSYSVEAVDRILTWGEQNGYTFLPLNSSSFPAHHPINN